MRQAFVQFLIHARESWQHNAVDLFLGERKQDGSFWVADPVTFHESSPHEVTDIPAIRLHREEAQALMDQLWNCGVRPTEGNGSAGQAAATAQHLKDMREIAMGALKKVGLL